MKYNKNLFKLKNYNKKIKKYKMNYMQNLKKQKNYMKKIKNKRKK